MSNASGRYAVAKSHQDHHGSQSEQLRTLVPFQSEVSVSSYQRSDVVWLTVASQSYQIARVANFAISRLFYSGVTCRHNGAGIQRSQCVQWVVLRMRLEQRWNIKHVVTSGVQRSWKQGDGPGNQAGWHRKDEIAKSALYWNLATRPGVQNFLWILGARRYFCSAHMASALSYSIRMHKVEDK